LKIVTVSFGQFCEQLNPILKLSQYNEARLDEVLYANVDPKVLTQKEFKSINIFIGVLIKWYFANKINMFMECSCTPVLNSIYSENGYSSGVTSSVKKVVKSIDDNMCKSLCAGDHTKATSKNNNKKNQ